MSATAHLTVTGFEQGTDSGTVMVSFNGFTETIPYTQFSSNVSLAGTLAALFTRDYHAYGLWAKAGANVTDLNVITFQLTNGKTFGSISYTLPSTSFGLVPSGFGSNGAVTADSGLVTLYVGGSAVAATRYGDGSTPASITEDLASSSSTNNLVSVKADGDLLYVTAQQPGSGSDFPYNVTITHDTQDFPLASFQVTPMSGSLTGGADAGPAATPTVVYSYTAQYDTASNVRVLNDSVMGNWSYGYDALNRLMSGQAVGGPYASQPFLCWSYDNFGNRTHQSQSNQPFVNAVGSPCQAAPGGTFLDAAAGYGSNNQITSMAQPGQPVLLSPSYDAAGDVVNDGTTTYLYDAEGRVCAVHGVYGMTGYQYDADGNRVGKGTLTSMSCDLTVNGYTPTNDYVLGPDNSQMTEVAITEGNQPIWQHTNVKADGMLVATYDTSGLHFYLNDALGTRRAQTDATGQWEQNCQSLPFGDQLHCTMSNDSPSENHFTGKERDNETGLDYFGARYYASSMGRFMSPDWAAKAEPVPYAKLNNPQSLDLYAYVQNNPLARLDTDGHQDEKDAEGEAELALARNARTALRPITRAEAEAIGWPTSQLSPEQRAFNEHYLVGSGGRWGTNATRTQNTSIADMFRSLGWRVLGGAYAKEEWLPGPGGGRKGGTFVDLTVTDGKQIVRVQTVSLTPKGELTPEEAAAAKRIMDAHPHDRLFLEPKTAYRRLASGDPVISYAPVK